jgi:hypothetical protein
MRARRDDCPRMSLRLCVSVVGFLLVSTSNGFAQSASVDRKALILYDGPSCDRYLAICCTRFWGVPHPVECKALVRIEDVSTDDDPIELRRVADYLSAQNVPLLARPGGASPPDSRVATLEKSCMMSNCGLNPIQLFLRFHPR